MTSMHDLLSKHNHITHAINAAWRRMRASTAASITIGEFVQMVLAECPDANEKYVRQELKRRLENYRPAFRKRRSRRTATRKSKEITNEEGTAIMPTNKT